MRPTRFAPLALILVLLAGVRPLAAQAPAPASPGPGLPSETPAKFKPTHVGFDYERREAMIPMRDGVKLHTVILVPKGAKGAPMLLTRTPYEATRLTTRYESAHLGPSLDGYDNAVETIVEGGYIRVVQDVRGKYDSEGDYVMNRPLRGPLNPTPVDHATDTYDTIDWLVKNVPESNGKVGILGISYDGFLPLMALVDPHPALKVSVPMNPMVDGWRGRRLVPQRRLPRAGAPLHLRAGGDARQQGEVVDEPLRRLRHVPRGGDGGRARPAARDGAARLLAEAPRAPDVRRLLERAGGRPDPRGPAADGAGDARPQPLGPGGHLRGPGGLQGDQAEGHRERQGLPRHGPLVPLAGDPRRQLARRRSGSTATRRSRSGARSSARSSTST